MGITRTFDGATTQLSLAEGVKAIVDHWVNSTGPVFSHAFQGITLVQESGPRSVRETIYVGTSELAVKILFAIWRIFKNATFEELEYALEELNAERPNANNAAQSAPIWVMAYRYPQVHLSDAAAKQLAGARLLAILAGLPTTPHSTAEELTAATLSRLDELE